MFLSKHVKEIVPRMKQLDITRRQLFALSNEILAGSKRAIFAFHRDDAKGAQQELQETRKKITDAKMLIKKEVRLTQEGSWRAAQEEFAEASLFAQYLETGTIDRISEIGDDIEIFLGALSDLTGELVRRCVRLASQRDTSAKDIEKIFTDVDAAVELLLQMDLTGNLRTKVDQAKQNLRKLEEIRYDLAIRKK